MMTNRQARITHRIAGELRALGLWRLAHESRGSADALYFGRTPGPDLPATAPPLLVLVVVQSDRMPPTSIADALEPHLAHWRARSRDWSPPHPHSECYALELVVTASVVQVDASVRRLQEPWRTALWWRPFELTDEELEEARPSATGDDQSAGQSAGSSTP